MYTDRYSAVAAGVCFFTCLGCIPYCISSLKDVHHQCGNVSSLGSCDGSFTDKNSVTCHLLITTEVDERKYAASRSNDEKRHEIVLF